MDALSKSSVNVDGADLCRSIRLSTGCVAVSVVQRRRALCCYTLTLSAPATSASTTVQCFIVRRASCSNRLMMMNHADNTQLLSLATRQQLNKELRLQSATVSFSWSVSNLGVTSDRRPTTSHHCQACFFSLCQIQQVRSSLTSEKTKTLVHAFISSCLDYS